MRKNSTRSSKPYSLHMKSSQIHKKEQNMIESEQTTRPLGLACLVETLTLRPHTILRPRGGLKLKNNLKANSALRIRQELQTGPVITANSNPPRNHNQQSRMRQKQELPTSTRHGKACTGVRHKVMVAQLKTAQPGLGRRRLCL